MASKQLAVGQVLGKLLLSVKRPLFGGAEHDKCLCLVESTLRRCSLTVLTTTSFLRVCPAQHQPMKAFHAARCQPHLLVPLVDFDRIFVRIEGLNDPECLQVLKEFDGAWGLANLGLVMTD